MRLGLGCAGDRTDDAIVAMGEIAGREADEVVVKYARHYLRGREPEELLDLFRVGLAHAGTYDVPGYGSELESLVPLVEHAHDGDVVALMCHAERTEVDAWIRAQGGSPDDAKTIRRKVVAARGEHELEAEITALWELETDEARIAAARELSASRPGDPRLLHELAGALDAAGEEPEAIGLYEEALAAGLKEPHRHRAQLQLASSLRAVGRVSEAEPAHRRGAGGAPATTRRPSSSAPSCRPTSARSARPSQTSSARRSTRRPTPTRSPTGPRCSPTPTRSPPHPAPPTSEPLPRRGARIPLVPHLTVPRAPCPRRVRTFHPRSRG